MTIQLKVFHRSEELCVNGTCSAADNKSYKQAQSMGIDIKDDVYTVGYAKKVILEMLEQKKNK